MFITTAKVFKPIYRCRKLVTSSKKRLIQPFHCNYNFTCSISAHAQILNEYPDAKNTFEYNSNEQMMEQIFVAAQIKSVFKSSDYTCTCR